MYMYDYEYRLDEGLFNYYIMQSFTWMISDSEVHIIITLSDLKNQSMADFMYFLFCSCIFSKHKSAGYNIFIGICKKCPLHCCFCRAKWRTNSKNSTFSVFNLYKNARHCALVSLSERHISQISDSAKWPKLNQTRHKMRIF